MSEWQELIQVVHCKAEQGLTQLSVFMTQLNSVPPDTKLTDGLFDTMCYAARDLHTNS